MKYPRTYALLKNIGHSPVKAAEIVLDASRGDSIAVDWVKIIWKARRRYLPACGPHGIDPCPKYGDGGAL